MSISGSAHILKWRILRHKGKGWLADRLVHNKAEDRYPEETKMHAIPATLVLTSTTSMLFPKGILFSSSEIFPCHNCPWAISVERTGHSWQWSHRSDRPNWEKGGFRVYVWPTTWHRKAGRQELSIEHIHILPQPSLVPRPHPLLISSHTDWLCR